MEDRPFTIIPFDRGSKPYKAKRYLERAETLRAIADDMVPCACRDTLLKVASSYQEMAAKEVAPSQ